MKKTIILLCSVTFLAGCSLQPTQTIQADNQNTNVANANTTVLQPTLTRYDEMIDNENKVRFNYPADWIIEERDSETGASGPVFTLREPRDGGLELTLYVNFMGGFTCSAVESKAEITLKTSQTVTREVTSVNPECDPLKENLTTRGILVQLPTAMGATGASEGVDVIVGRFDSVITPDGVNQFDQILSSLELL